MKLHLLGIPHTYTHPAFSCCAFTGKVLRFSPMMQSVGYHVIHYGNAGSVSGADEEQVILEREEYAQLGGCEPSDRQYGLSARLDSPLYARFNEELADALERRVEPGDIICLPFGFGHHAALRNAGGNIQKAFWVETGIGYPNAFAPFRIYESASWMYCHMGRGAPEGAILGNDYWFVIPNYYDTADWIPGRNLLRHSKTINFLGRLNEDKGLRIIAEIAKRRPGIQFNLCGQGDISHWCHGLQNVRQLPAIHGDPKALAEYLGSGAATICPSRYSEPFCGVAAESLLCGTPVLASAFGAMTEYITPGGNGMLCRTLADWLDAVDYVTSERRLYCMDPERIAADAEARFSLASCAVKYDAAFRQIADLAIGGWYAHT